VDKDEKKKAKKEDEGKEKKGRDKASITKPTPVTISRDKEASTSTSKDSERATKTISLIYTITKRQYIRQSVSALPSTSQMTMTVTSSLYKKFAQDETDTTKAIEGYLAKQSEGLTFNMSSEIAKISSKLSSCSIGTVSVIPVVPKPPKYVLSLDLPTKKNKKDIKMKKENKDSSDEKNKESKGKAKDEDEDKNKHSTKKSKLTTNEEEHGMLDVFNFLKKIPEDEIKGDSGKENDQTPAVFVSGALKTGTTKDKNELSNRKVKFWGFVQNLLAE
ncbi:hypothetical protein THOM_3045, partial [Trachipleistophora hominis]